MTTKAHSATGLNAECRVVNFDNFMAENIGNVIQITGPAVDVQFNEAAMPPIYQALRVVSEGFNVPLLSMSFWKCSSIWAKAACARLQCRQRMVWCAA